MSGAKVVKSNVYCSVYNCNTYYCEDKSVSFYWFPKEKQCTVPWTNKLNTLIDEEPGPLICEWIKKH